MTNKAPLFSVRLAQTPPALSVVGLNMYSGCMKSAITLSEVHSWLPMIVVKPGLIRRVKFALLRPRTIPNRSSRLREKNQLTPYQGSSGALFTACHLDVDRGGDFVLALTSFLAINFQVQARGVNAVVVSFLLFHRGRTEPDAPFFAAQNPGCHHLKDAPNSAGPCPLHRREL